MKKWWLKLKLKRLKRKGILSEKAYQINKSDIDELEALEDQTKKDKIIVSKLEKTIGITNIIKSLKSDL
ncbi:hypothetical protein ACFO3O_03610 [Dokdonia ponticola]|uniref:General stress protein CsbD n=1 Tax=Dokdonia ponticola TaxID=2041041 RepID=A0ABV9HTN7_9FLAO